MTRDTFKAKGTPPPAAPLQQGQVDALEVFRIAGGDTECEPNPTPERALEVLRDLRACYDEAIAQQAAETSNARSEWPARYMANGPQGTFYTDDLKLADALLRAYDEDDDWTVTEMPDPAGTLAVPQPPSAPVGVEDIEVLNRLRAALPNVGLNGWWLGVEVLDRVISTLTQQPAASRGDARRLVEKMAAHVRPTCSELWHEAQAFLAAQQQEHSDG